MIYQQSITIFCFILTAHGSYLSDKMVIESDVVTEVEVFDLTVPPKVKAKELGIKHKDAEIKLKCHELKAKGMNDIVWQFKMCGYGLSLTPCEDLRDDAPWQEVMCRNGTKACERITLPITKPREQDSGIYRCLYKNYMEQRYRVDRVIQLEVRDPLTKSMEILDEESEVDNQTVLENQTAVLRCRVRSLAYPHIMWARLATTMLTSSTLKIGGVYHHFLNASQLHGPNKTYTSKLYLPNLKLYDAGQYKCIALDGRHNLSKTVTLTVMPSLSSHNFQDSTTVASEEIWCIAAAFMVSAINCILVIFFVFHRMRRKAAEISNEDKLSVQQLC